MGRFRKKRSERNGNPGKSPASRVAGSAASGPEPEATARRGEPEASAGGDHDSQRETAAGDHDSERETTAGAHVSIRQTTAPANAAASRVGSSRHRRDLVAKRARRDPRTDAAIDR